MSNGPRIDQLVQGVEISRVVDGGDEIVTRAMVSMADGLPSKYVSRCRVLTITCPPGDVGPADEIVRQVPALGLVVVRREVPY